jgi:hypothetical protein
LYWNLIAHRVVLGVFSNDTPFAYQWLVTVTIVRLPYTFNIHTYIIITLSSVVLESHCSSGRFGRVFTQQHLSFEMSRRLPILNSSDEDKIPHRNKSFCAHGTNCEFNALTCWETNVPSSLYKCRGATKHDCTRYLYIFHTLNAN